MKIAAARVRPVRLRFARPMHHALGGFCEREVVHLELRDSDGVGGWGEAAPGPGFGTETPADSLAALQEMARVLKPGGLAVISVPHLSRRHELPHDYYRFTPEGLVRILQAAGLAKGIFHK